MTVSTTRDQAAIIYRKQLVQQMSLIARWYEAYNRTLGKEEMELMIHHLHSAELVMRSILTLREIQG